MARGKAKRWVVQVDYADTGERFSIEELSELHDIIERGPDWNLISKITIQLANSRRVDLRRGK